MGGTAHSQGRVAADAIAISLTKGMRMRAEGPQLISELVRRKLGVDCSVLMGANIAGEIGAGQLSEATIGYRVLDNARVFKQLFQTAAFNVSLVADVEGAEMCGTLKNVVAIAAGLSDGLGFGSNTKAAIIRQGLAEMRRLSKRMCVSVGVTRPFHSLPPSSQSIPQSETRETTKETTK